MATIAKHLVSKKKRRFMEDGFDLDMTFITKNIVAMGFPAEGREGIYRNNMRDVKRFFDTRYPDHYKVYNLCSERDYPASKFYGRVAKFPFDDHNAPPFLLIEPFCQDVEQFLSEDERNVAVIHCKAGKGRTGVMICAYMLHAGLWEKTEDGLEFYGHARTTNGKGVTIPSQVRYVHYYGRYLRMKRELGVTYSPKTLIMQNIILKGVPDFNNGTCVPQFTISQGPDKVLIFKSGTFEGITKDQETAELQLHPPTPVCGDVKVEFFHKKSTGKEKMFHLWFNTFFIDGLKFTAQQSTIDKANKDKKNKIFPSGFGIEIQFSDIDSETAQKTAMSVKRQEEKLSFRLRQQSIGNPDPEAMAGTASDDTDEPRKSAAASAMLRQRLSHQDSNISQAAEWSDDDLTTTDDDDDEWEGLPISDV